MGAELIQIYYADYQKQYLFPCARPYFNDHLTIFFENSVIAKLVMEAKTDKIGVFSWKLREKLRWYIGKPRPVTQEVIETDYDVLSFTRNTKYHKMLEAASVWHPEFRPTLDKICGRVGIKVPNEVKTPIYQNSFMAKTDIYQDYVTTYLKPIMDLVESDQEIYKLAISDSNYTTLAKQDSASSEELQRKIGMPYYPIIPFILERLFSIYVENKNINVTWL